MAFPTPPSLPRLGAEVTAQQEQEDTERGDADDPKNWISYVEHIQNFNRYCAESCTFKLDGKSVARAQQKALAIAVSNNKTDLRLSGLLA